MRRALAATLVLLSACATIRNGTHADVTIRSEPPGAAFELRDQHGTVVATGETPATVSLSRTSRYVGEPAQYELTVSKQGYLAKRTALTTRFDTWAYVDQILVFPGLVDSLAGSSWKIEEPPVQVLSPDVPFQRPGPGVSTQE